MFSWQCQHFNNSITLGKKLAWHFWDSTNWNINGVRPPVQQRTGYSIAGSMSFVYPESLSKLKVMCFWINIIKWIHGPGCSYPKGFSHLQNTLASGPTDNKSLCRSDIGQAKKTLWISIICYHGSYINAICSAVFKFSDIFSRRCVLHFI